MISDEFGSILNKYEKQKLNSYKVIELLGDDYTFNDFGADTTDRRYMQILNCGTQLFFEKETTTKTVYHLKAANFCRQRICPMCQFRKSERMFAQMLQVVQELEKQYRFIHLVLTIPNSSYGSELIAGIKVLYKAYNMLMHRNAYITAFKGALRCLEVSYNYDTDTFHPHLHCLIAVNKSYFNDSKVYLSRDKIMQDWTKAVKKAIVGIEHTEYINRDCDYQVYVRACKEGDYEGVAEVCKYCLKPLQLDDNSKSEQNKRFLLTVWHTLKNMRFVQKYGVIKDCFAKLFNETKDELEEVIQGKHTPNCLYIEWDYEQLNYKEV